MAIDGYTTSIESASTVAEIGALLAKFGASRIMTEYESGRPSGITFEVKTEVGLRTFSLPVRAEGVLKTLVRDKVQPKYRTPEHAERVAWRIALVWLRAQLAIIDTGMASLDEIMLPWMLTARGETMHSLFVQNSLGQLES